LSIGRLQDAKESFKQGSSINPDDKSLKEKLELTNEMIRYYEDLQQDVKDNDFVDAIRKCEMILKNCQDFVKIQLLNVELKVKKGDLDDAKKLIDSLKSGGNNE